MMDSEGIVTKVNPEETTMTITIKEITIGMSPRNRVSLLLKIGKKWKTILIAMNGECD